MALEPHDKNGQPIQTENAEKVKALIMLVYKCSWAFFFLLERKWELKMAMDESCLLQNTEMISVQPILVNAERT